MDATESIERIDNRPQPAHEDSEEEEQDEDAELAALEYEGAISTVPLADREKR